MKIGHSHPLPNGFTLLRLIPGLFFCFLTAAVIVPVDLSAELLGSPVSISGTTVSMDVAPVFQPKTHVSGGGDITVSRYSVAANVRIPLRERLHLGLGLSYEFDDYNFTRLTSFAVADPWNKIHRAGITGRFVYSVNPRWNLFFAPMGQFAGETGADAGKSLLYGGALGASYSSSKDFTIGFGAGAFYRLEETAFFRSLIVNWNITDRLHLVNPFRLGPAGPAGIELGYSLDSNWEVALGGGYRSYRFRLDANGPVPSGIGQTTSAPVYLSLSRRFGKDIRLHAYGGAAFAGKIRVEDRAGNRIDSTSYSTAPLMGITLSAAF
ncbi:MAG TPA: DUF6268 family outer membrane beta-barrel protein [Syntrophorhabdaceae bacterium]|jgi:hypothetical protein